MRDLVSGSHSVKSATSSFKYEYPQHCTPRNIIFICCTLVRTAAEVPSCQWKRMLERREHPPHHSWSFHRLVAFRLDVTETAPSSCRGSEDRLLTSHARDVFYSPSHRSPGTSSWRQSECEEGYLISSDWERTHCYSFATHSANCMIRHAPSCPIRKQCKRHSTSMLLSGDAYRSV